MEILEEIWKFVKDNPAAAGVILTAVLAVIGGAWKFFRYLSAKPNPDRPGQRIKEGDENIQIGQARDVSISKGTDVDVNAIVERLEERARREGILSVRLEDANQREEELRGQVRQLTEAVEALKAEAANPEAPPGVGEALALLAKGETEATEAVFEQIKERRKTPDLTVLDSARKIAANLFRSVGISTIYLRAADKQTATPSPVTNKEAAAAARHIGALAYLHDTEKALAAYREAVALDPDDPSGWNQLGHLLKRAGDLDGATETYTRVLSLGNRMADQGLIAVATGNLGNLYMTRGELKQAEEMYRKSLGIAKVLGRKEGMADQYGNLGVLYKTRGELDRAEEMHHESLVLNEALGREEGMASQYGNLGNLYEIRGELERAEVMYRKSLDLNEALGRKQGVASQYGNLGNLHAARGEFELAEGMYRKSLDINEVLGRRQGMANQYGNLGIIYQNRGELDRAEVMYLKSLEFNEALGRKEGMAIATGNLGVFYETRGEFDRAEKMYRESLKLFRAIGAMSKIEHVEDLLAELREAK